MHYYFRLNAAHRQAKRQRSDPERRGAATICNTCPRRGCHKYLVRKVEPAQKGYATAIRLTDTTPAFSHTSITNADRQPVHRKGRRMINLDITWPGVGIGGSEVIQKWTHGIFYPLSRQPNYRCKHVTLMTYKHFKAASRNGETVLACQAVYGLFVTGVSKNDWCGE